MSDRIEIDVQGFRELEQKIKMLANDKDKRRESLILLRQIAKPTLAAARNLAPVSKKAHWARKKKIQPGNLKKSLGNITGRSKTTPTIYVGARAKRQHDGWYAHFVHDGVNVYRKGFKRKRKKGANAGAAIARTKGNPFLRKAYEQTKGTVTADAEDRFAKFLQRRIDKLSR